MDWNALAKDDSANEGVIKDPSCGYVDYAESTMSIADCLQDMTGTVPKYPIL